MSKHPDHSQQLVRLGSAVWDELELTLFEMEERRARWPLEPLALWGNATTTETWGLVQVECFHYLENSYVNLVLHWQKDGCSQMQPPPSSLEILLEHLQPFE
jgi:hypothetical protein